jgi:secretion/DNA translocation related TadE-like protein
VFAVAVVATLLCFALGCCVAGAAVVTHRRAESAADLAALAAAQALQEGGDTCAAARAVARANGARVDSCRIVGLDAVVGVRVDGPALLGGLALPARARAGPDDGAGQPASSRSSSATAPALSSGLFWLPHFGDCTHEAQPSRHSQAAIASRVAVSQSSAAA